MSRGTWVAPSFKRPTSMPHGLLVCEFEPLMGLTAVSTEPALHPLSSLSLPPSPNSHTRSLKNKHKKFFFRLKNKQRTCVNILLKKIYR